MSSRDKILGTVKGNQPAQRELPALPSGPAFEGDLSARFVSVLEAIGGAAYVVSGYDRIATIIHEQYPRVGRIITGCRELGSIGEYGESYADPHLLEDVGLAVLAAHFGVAENGACWITEDRMVERALPFITQHLALVLRKQDIVANMHAAYERIAEMEGGDTAAGKNGTGVDGAAGKNGGRPDGFATFIAGPSKTADIEQSLVLGAHGPRSMVVFLIDEGISDAGFF